eukprot:3123022-Rhodomonas_salina.4
MESDRACVQVPRRVFLARAGISCHVCEFIARVPDVSCHPHNTRGRGPASEGVKKVSEYVLVLLFLHPRLKVSALPERDGIQDHHAISIEGERGSQVSYG